MAGLWRVFEQARAQHGRERERHHGRDQDGHSQGDGEFVKQAAHHVTHEEQGDQHGDE